MHADPGKPLRVERLLANLGYGKRKEIQQLVMRKRVVRKDGQKLKVGDKVFSTELLLEGEELDPPFPMVILVNKPVGYVVTSPEDPKVLDPKVYDLLPFRWVRGCDQGSHESRGERWERCLWERCL
jgi:16S rRNA pseudouridine516 synthase